MSHFSTPHEKRAIIEAAALIASADSLLKVDRFDVRIAESVLHRVVDAAGLIAAHLSPKAMGKQPANPTGRGYYVCKVTKEPRA